MFNGAQTAGDTNVVAVGWNDATSTITSVSDGAGNAYQVAAPVARGTGLSQAIYYAKNIASAPAGANGVTVTFNAVVRFADIRILEYSGLDPNTPFDVARSASGSTTLADSGNLATNYTSELVFAAGMTTNRFTAAGAGFTNRIITSSDGDIAEDRRTSAIGVYNATAPLNAAAAWLIQIATFRAAGQRRRRTRVGLDGLSDQVIRQCACCSVRSLSASRPGGSSLSSYVGTSSCLTPR